MLRRSPGRTAGMTLLEIMVVVVIIAVLVSMSVLSLGDNNARLLSEESRRIQTLIRLAADDATLQGREIGIAFDNERYQFLVYDDQFRGWQSITDDPIFRPRNMPGEVRMELYLDDQKLELPVAATESEAAEQLPTPQVLVLSSGEMTPFELRFHSDGTDMEITVEAQANGIVEEHVRR